MVEMGSRTPYQEKVFLAVDQGDVKEQSHFLCICPVLMIKDFSFLITLTLYQNFCQLPLEARVKFILSNYDNYIYCKLSHKCLFSLVIPHV